MSKQLTRLKEISLYKYTNVSLPDGSYSKEYTLINNYKVILQELDDEIAINLYGADINRMLRMSSTHNTLENYLYTKLNNTSDNVSKYEIEYLNNKYEIKNVRKSYIDCKRL